MERKYKHLCLFNVLIDIEYWSESHALLQENPEFLITTTFLIQRSNPCLLCLLHLPVSSSPRVPPGKPILYMAVCTCESQPPNLSFPVSFPFGNCEPVFHVCGSVSLLYISSLASLFLSFLVSHVSGSVCHVSLASFT